MVLMPRYFFHIVDDDGRVPDHEGMEFPDHEAAKEECEGSAQQIFLQNLLSHREIDNRRIEVTDESGQVVRVCHLKDLLN
jgi:hypothetical protein